MDVILTASQQPSQDSVSSSEQPQSSTTAAADSSSKDQQQSSSSEEKKQDDVSVSSTILRKEGKQEPGGAHVIHVYILFSCRSLISTETFTLNFFSSFCSKYYLYSNVLLFSY